MVYHVAVFYLGFLSWGVNLRSCGLLLKIANSEFDVSVNH